MRRIWKRIGALALGAALLLTSLTVGAGAAEVSSVTMEMRPNVTILVDGVERTFYNAQGQEVHPLYYQGTHYLPVRAIGELMGKNVNWDGSTKTITLSGTRTTGNVQGTPDADAQVQDITVQIHPDFTIVVDDTVRSFTDAQGKAVYPVLYQGTNYLPVRAIGELMGKSVSWNGATRTITLTGDSLVMDADTFGPSGTTSGNSGSVIGEAAAQAKALAHAGLTASQVTFIQSKLDWDDGRRVYDVEFYTKDYREYDYEIDAYTGAVLSYDSDAENWTRPSGGTGSTDSGSYIGEAKAQSIALSAAGLTASQVSRLRCHLERDDGRWEYQVEFRSGSMEYEYEIDALTGSILSRDMDSIYD